MNQPIKERCRLVLIMPDTAFDKAQMSAAFEGGDIASVIVPQYQLNEGDYQDVLSSIVEIAQPFDTAVVAAGDTRIAGRCGADGIHVVGGFTEIRSALKEHGQKWIIGSGGAENRHAALTLAEEDPDYVFFGRFGQDTHAEPHKRNIALGEWWSQVVEVPCIIMGGNDLAALGVAAGTGTDFVALSHAVLGEGVDAKAACASANSILEQFTFEEDAA